MSHFSHKNFILEHPPPNASPGFWTRTTSAARLRTRSMNCWPRFWRTNAHLLNHLACSTCMIKRMMCFFFHFIIYFTYTLYHHKILGSIHDTYCTNCIITKFWGEFITHTHCHHKILSRNHYIITNFWGRIHYTLRITNPELGKLILSSQMFTLTLQRVNFVIH